MSKLMNFMVFQKAFAAVVYIRYKLKDGSYFVNAVASKTKVNPIERKNLAIQKLELMDVFFESTPIFNFILH